ncbi:phospholipase D family protein [Ornithinimicrobium pratense]|uniref:PLD phosphodiesterase domain-containing protein n=1 Tax=Ornithinimicrobium pratense TaxID=2593973 RepID=A0A5J6V643_9MICO|nr:phospholipase D family protein [Ornithinimicrobium pratense]QFG69245.1 hypothetical protein FY030_11485 [Ornithinimicrobium pratense]
MLEPSTRTLFVDAFRPPTGHVVDLAVGTTYTLSLRMLLLPPLAMAAHDRESELSDSGDGTDPTEETEHSPADTLALLEAVRRYADRTTVYCHASGIASPGRYPRLLAFSEDSVVQVLPRTPGHIFHPKMWALRFRQDDDLIHRLVVCSRNLTEDSSWDTLLVLDEGEPDQGISGAPAAEFVRALPSLTVGPVAPGRPEQAETLAATLEDVWFDLPAPFTGGELLPLGLRAGTASWPMPEHPTRAVVVSPFLDIDTVSRVKARRTPVLVSRPESYDLVGAEAVAHTSTKVLSPHAETQVADPRTDSPTRAGEVRDGLHAKLLVWDEGRTGHLLTGSANATHAAFHGNVEFGVLLTGPRRSCGVEALLPDEAPSRDRVTFDQVLQDHNVVEPEPQEDTTRQTERQIELHHEGLLQAGPRLSCEQDESGYAVTLQFEDTLPRDPGTTSVRLVSRPRTELRPPDRARWEGVPLLQLTPYLEVVTTVPISDTERMEVASVLKAELVDAPEERAAEVLRSYLGSEESLVRYLRFLLDEADAGSVWDDLELGDAQGDGAGARRPTFEDLAILEPLLRAAADGSEALDRVQALLRDLGVRPDQPGVVPQEFLQLWQAVWDATREGRP